MPGVDHRVIPTDTYEEAAHFVPAANSVYLYGQSAEERSSHVLDWRDRARDVDFVRITEADEMSIQVQGSADRVALRSDIQLERLCGSNAKATRIYIDITGLPHHVWAPIVRSAIAIRKHTAVVYVEPGSYTKSAVPVEGEIYDLSSKIVGISPIPGFSFLSEKGQGNVFVPLLGFEGTRLAYLIEQVQPSNDRIVPILGCPGFKPEFFYESYFGNKRPLQQTEAWRQIRYVAANCPFSCFYELRQIALEHPLSTLMIAPIGTKPHALGAVMFHLTSDNPVELVYDHPIRKPGRTTGKDRLLVYYVSTLVPSVKARITPRAA
jgi:hypothetical protein